MKLVELLAGDRAVCKTGAVDGNSIFSNRQRKKSFITQARTGSENKWAD